MGWEQWKESDLQAHYQHAVNNGWVPFFEAAAQQHNLPPELLMAIASRETDMRNIAGDVQQGVPQGYGIMQVDIKSNPAFCKTWNKDDVQGSINAGTAMLAQKRDILAQSGITDIRLIAAAYNCGQNRVLDCVKAQPTQDPDQHTTYQNYGTDVVNRMQVFTKLRAGSAQSTST
jgi:soluble lytic murein transglycosylase-like protein